MWSLGPSVATASAAAWLTRGGNRATGRHCSTSTVPTPNRPRTRPTPRTCGSSSRRAASDDGGGRSIPCIGPSLPGSRRLSTPTPVLQSLLTARTVSPQCLPLEQRLPRVSDVCAAGGTITSCTAPTATSARWQRTARCSAPSIVGGAALCDQPVAGARLKLDFHALVAAGNRRPSSLNHLIAAHYAEPAVFIPTLSSWDDQAASPFRRTRRWPSRG